ncbi:MAG: molybdopterin-synthase adenylyltransferase MoeB [Alteromonadaceae bacterium]|nr:molybdopterin-synthase adenylyltransferase MoeB [Alteromonadaceae bacterium]
MSREITVKEAARFNRQILMPDFDIERQEVLLASKVLIVGMGGLGCACAQYLVGSGIGTLTLTDDDKVEESNLHRQVLHHESDIGKDKVTSAQETLLSMNANVKINSMSKRLSQTELTEVAAAHDLIVDCSDNLATRNSVNQASIETRTPLVSGAAIRMDGQISCFDPRVPDSPCYVCLSRLFEEQNLSCVESGVMSPLVGVIGSIQAMETIKMLTDYGEPAIGKLMIYQAKNACWQQLTLKKDPSCPVCS